MSDKTGIEWTATRNPDGSVTPGATWNPLRGCRRVSEGCRHCYAERVAARFSGPGQPYEGLAKMTPSGPRWTGEVRLLPDLLDVPLRWKTPRRVFVNSMSDLFHEDVPFDFIGRVFGVMEAAHWHTFQVLTKRPAQMLKAMGHWDVQQYIDQWPVPNVWLGVSVEDQAAADERIPLLLRTPAAVRWISAEPLLGPVELREWRLFDREPRILPSLDWLVVGGESGPGARPMHPDWARSLRDQCQASGTAFFFKQWGEIIPSGQSRPGTLSYPLGELAWQAGIEAFGGKPASRVYYDDDTWGYRVGKKAAGRLLDGRAWNEYPSQH